RVVILRRLGLAAALATAACATVVGAEVTRPAGGDRTADGVPVDSDDAAPTSGEGGPVEAAPPIDSGLDTGPSTACGCAFDAACCVGSAGPPSCVEPGGAACAAAGDFLLGCVRATSDGRDCCWNEAGAPHQTKLGLACK